METFYILFRSSFDTFIHASEVKQLLCVLDFFFSFLIHPTRNDFEKAYLKNTFLKSPLSHVRDDKYFRWRDIYFLASFIISQKE